MLLRVLSLFFGCLTLTQGKHVDIPCKPCVCRRTSSDKLVANCKDKHLSDIPKHIPNSVAYLFMSYNSIYHLPGGSFKRFSALEHLDLSFNQLKRLHVDTFTGATNLLHLNLNGNYLQLYESAYPVGVFRQQKKLLTLNIAKNTDVAHSVYPDQTLGDLTALQTLFIDGVQNASFGIGFSKLKNLTTLSLSGERGHCSVQTLLNTSFLHTPFVRNLDISKCRITFIEANTFWPLRHIHTLDMSDNQYLGFDRMGEALYGLRYSSLSVLKINRIVTTFAIGVHIKKNNTRYLSDLSLKEIHMDTNRVELIDQECLGHLKTVELIFMNHNRVTFGIYLLSLNKLTNLRTIYGYNQYSSNIPFNTVEAVTDTNLNPNPPLSSFDPHPIVRYSLETIHACERYEAECSNSHSYRKNHNNHQYDVRLDQTSIMNLPFKIPLPPNATYANFSNSKLNYDILELNFQTNKFKTIDLSHNVFSNWTGPIHECQTVEYLDLSENYCKYVSHTFFMFASGLKVLNISKNYLSVSLLDDTDGQIFANQTNLEVIRIAHNLIRELPPAIFRGLTRLEVLDLSWNMMTSWNIEIRHMLHLHTLDISGNRYEGIPTPLTKQIDHIMRNRNDTFHLSIKGNILKCDCPRLESLEWITRPYITFEDPGNTKCTLSDGESISFTDIEDVIAKLQLRCKIVIPILSIAVFGLLLFMLIFGVGMVYRYRWKLRYLYYTTRRKYRGYQRQGQEEDHFTYDAFVSYAETDRGFVIQDMRAVLERTYGLRLCIHDRDFMVGEAITANIINAIQSSRKTIAVLSPDFAKSSWCDYEVHMAKLESIHTGRNVLCVLWYSHIPDIRILSRDIQDMIEYDTYIKYPTQENDKEEFWTKVKAAISF
ncbi:toll-like receptor 4 [Haliotis asinina]|uniref:toll-like receptor 4 n=1 Tax=Haliotis asinina TaxID=109174 RepID=UPI003531B225